MNKFKSLFSYFSKAELALWISSVALIVISFCIFDRSSYLILAASVIGATSLIFNAKGNAVGQILMVIFSVLYGIVSFSFAYYGEMITYLGMTAPIAVLAVISWLKNPYQGNRAEVKVNTLTKKEIFFMIFLTVFVTAVFYFILKDFHTANLIPSTIHYEFSRRISHLSSQFLLCTRPRKYFMGYTVITWSVFCCFVIKPSRYRLCKQAVLAAARRSAALSHR